MNDKCICGGLFKEEKGVEGYFCDKCGEWKESLSEDITDLSLLYGDVERIKAIRGIPMSEIIIGSETKGRIKVIIPCYATPAESKLIIDTHLDLLQYTKEQILNRGLDIFTIRGKKDELQF